MIRNRNGKFERFDVIHSMVGGSMEGSDDIGYTFHDGQTPPTEAEINAEIVKLEAEYAAQAYARSRAVLYPDIGDQLDALYHAGVFPEDMAAKLKKVKDDNPKG